MSAARPAASAIADLSRQLATAVTTAARSVVAIHARRRIPSSGILWQDGVIVGAAHTVRRDGQVRVTLPNGDDATATAAGRDPATDLVALRLEGSLPGAPRGDLDALRVGSLVLAVGRPGRDVTASFGIVSAALEGWRTWQGTRVGRVLRLDLNVYDGFSGGPLVDAAGGVVAMNNSALARGTPMALPADAVDRVLADLLELGHVRRAFVGVAVQPVILPAPLVTRLALAHEVGLLVTSVADDSPASRAGLMVGDVLLQADDAPLRHPTDLLDALAAPPGELRLAVLRGGARTDVPITPAERDARGGTE